MATCVPRIRPATTVRDGSGVPPVRRVLGPDLPDIQATQARIEQLTSNLRGGE